MCVCVDLERDESKQHIHTQKEMAPNYWLFGGGDPAESSTISNTKRNHHPSKNKNSGERASATNLLSAQGYVKDERDDPHYSQKARRGREKVAEQLLRDMREESHSGERKSRRHHHRHGGGGAQNEAAEFNTGFPRGRSSTTPSYGSNSEYHQYQHDGLNTSATMTSSTSYSRLVGGCLIAGSVAMVCTASSDSVLGHLLLSSSSAKDDFNINASNNRGGVASGSKRKSASSRGGGGGGDGRGGISGWSNEYATNFLGAVTKNADDNEDDKLFEGDSSNAAIALANGETLLEKFDADAFERDLASTSGDFDDEEKRDVQLSDDDLLTTCETWRVQIKNDATMFQARLLKLSAILDATSDDSNRLPHDDVVNSIKSVRKWHTTTDVDATAKVKELTRRAKMEKAGDGKKSLRRKKLEAEAIKVEELASTSLPKLENALNEIEEKFIPASAQSEPVRQRAELGAAPTRSSWLSSLFGGVKQPTRMAQLGAATNLDASAELGAGYGGDPWGAHSKFDDELEMEEERDVKNERRKNVASLHERQRLQKEKERFGLVDEKVVESPVRATSFAKGLSNRRSRRVGPFYDAMENSEQQQQQQQRQITPSSIILSTPGGRIPEADIERRAQELVDEAHGGIEEGEEERVNEGEEVFDDDEVADAEAEEQSEDEQLIDEDEE